MLSSSRHARLFLTVMAIGACSDDDAPNLGPLDAQVDASQPDAKVDIDAKADAKVDASLDGGSCTLDQTYKVYQDGGLVQYHDVYTLGANGKLAVKRGPGNAQADAGADVGCSVDLPACDFAAGVSRSALVAAFSSPGVIAAFGDGSTVLGVDTRPVDGPVLVFERADGKKILVGSPCTGTTGCTAVPTDVEALRSVFNHLLAENPVGRQSDGGLVGSCSP